MITPLCFRTTLAAAASAATLLLANCGILTAPVSLPAAFASNSNFNFAGEVVDQNGRSLDGVIIRRENSHYFWTPLSGGRDVPDTLIKRADGNFEFTDRGQNLEFTFTKDGYLDATFRINRNDNQTVITPLGHWPLQKKFSAVMLSTHPRDAALAHFNETISYADYPIATAIALPNLATEGRSGDIKYEGKDAQDPTVFPPGTLYITLSKEPPSAINVKGEVDPADLDIPHHVTLRLPGPMSGLIHIEPRLGFHPIVTSDQAPASGYVREITLDRARLKSLRKASSDDILEGHEYFFFRTGKRYGKGTLSWANTSGKPAFRFDLYIQPQLENRDLTTHKLER